MLGCGFGKRGELYHCYDVNCGLARFPPCCGGRPASNTANLSASVSALASRSSIWRSTAHIELIGFVEGTDLFYARMARQLVFKSASLVTLAPVDIRNR
jgi:hypothetical protein